MADKSKSEKIGGIMQSLGKILTGCGCLLTILITIPIIILLFIL